MNSNSCWGPLFGKLRARCLFIMLLVAVPGIAAHAQHFTFASYDAGSGLTNLNAATLLQDRSGLLWVGTENGVFVLDGARFHKIQGFAAAGLENVRALREDSAGRIWAVDERHIAYWQAGEVHAVQAVRFKALSHEPLDLAVLSQVHDTVYLLEGGVVTAISSRNEGRSWLPTAVVAPDVAAAHPEFSKLISLATEGGTTLWAGCGKAICRFDPLHGQAIRLGEREGVPAHAWRALMVTRMGALWARSESSLLVRRRPSLPFEPRPLPALSFRSMRNPLLIEDPAGQIMLNGIEGFARDDGHGWRIYGQENGIPGDSIEASLFDRKGTLWFSSLGHGVMRWRGYGLWESWTRTEGLNSNIIWGISKGLGTRVWVSTEKGIAQIDPGSAKVLSQAGVSGRMLSVAVDGRSHVWIADATGRLLDMDPATGHKRIAADGLDHIFQLHLDREQRLWVCSRKGLLFFTGADGWTAPHFVSQLPSGYAWSITEGADGTLWVSNSKGLYRLQGQEWAAIQLPFPGGEAFNFMLAAAPDGTLWVQNKEPYPLLHLRVEGRRATILERVEAASFGSDNITFVEVDHSGRLWVGSDDGVHVYDGQQWVQCTAEDGLIWDDTDFHSFLDDPDGSIWIGTSAGVSHILRPESLFKVRIPEVHVLDVVLSGRALSASEVPRLNLPRPTLMVRLRDLNYDRGSAIVTRYRLEGEDNEWQDASGDSIRFPSLYPGRYKLQVLTYDRRTHASSPMESFSFVLLEPWWKSKPFLAIEAAAVLALILGLWRASLRFLVARQQELERLVSLRTEELEKEKRELLAARSELLETTRRDPLTGLLNRRAIFEHMQVLCEVAQSAGPSVAVIMADLDGFKRINDQYGHAAGDSILRECARRIEAVTRPVDFVGRYGGEELLILLPGLDQGSVRKRMEEIRLSISTRPIEHDDLLLSITCSFGVAWFDGGIATTRDLVGLADAALYLAKQNGRNRVEYADKPNFHPVSTLELTASGIESGLYLNPCN